MENRRNRKIGNGKNAQCRTKLAGQEQVVDSQDHLEQAVTKVTPRKQSTGQLALHPLCESYLVKDG